MARWGRGTGGTWDANEGKSGHGRSSNGTRASESRSNGVLRGADVSGTSREDEGAENHGEGDDNRRREETHASVGCDGKQMARQDGKVDKSSEGYVGIENGGN